MTDTESTADPYAIENADRPPLSWTSVETAPGETADLYALGDPARAPEPYQPKVSTTLRLISGRTLTVDDAGNGDVFILVSPPDSDSEGEEIGIDLTNEETYRLTSAINSARST